MANIHTHPGHICDFCWARLQVGAQEETPGQDLPSFHLPKRPEKAMLLGHIVEQPL